MTTLNVPPPSRELVFFAASAVPAIKPTTSDATRAPSRMAMVECLRTDLIRMCRDLPGSPAMRARPEQAAVSATRLTGWVGCTQSRGFASPARTGFAFIDRRCERSHTDGGKGVSGIRYRRAPTAGGTVGLFVAPYQ